MKGIIYQIKNIKNNKIYVGSTCDYKQREAKHRRDLCANKHHSCALQHAWNKYGPSMFVFEILEYVEELTVLVEREQTWIDLLKTYRKEFGYNCSKFAHRGEMTEEMRLKLSANLKGKPSFWKGKKHSEVTKLKIAEYRLGKRFSEGTKEKMRASQGLRRARDTTVASENVSLI